MDNIRKELLPAVDDVMTCEPDYLIMGMSSETFWDGLEGSLRLRERVEARAGVKVAMGSDAAQAALSRYGVAASPWSRPTCRSPTRRSAASSPIAGSRSCGSRA